MSSSSRLPSSTPTEVRLEADLVWITCACPLHTRARGGTAYCRWWSCELRLRGERPRPSAAHNVPAQLCDAPVPAPFVGTSAPAARSTPTRNCSSAELHPSPALPPSPLLSRHHAAGIMPLPNTPPAPPPPPRRPARPPPTTLRITRHPHIFRLPPSSFPLSLLPFPLPLPLPPQC